MKGYLIAGAALCVIAFAMNAGWIPAPGKLETATKQPATESAPLAVKLEPTPAIAPEPAAAAPEPAVASTPVAAPEPAAAPTPAAAAAPVAEPPAPTERTAEAPVPQPAAQPVVQPISQPVATQAEPRPAHADHAAHPKRHGKSRQ